MQKFMLRLWVLVWLMPMFMGVAYAAGDKPVPPRQDWQSRGIFGKMDKQSAQRGMQVYREVCAACHSLRLVSFRHLQALGYDEGQVKVLASESEVTDGPNEDGELFTRPGIPSDYFPNPYANDEEARLVNNGALPPDLSLIIKSRSHGRGNLFLNFADAISGGGSASGSDYMYALLTGYEEAPEDMDLQEGMHYNAWFAAQQIAMPAPLADGQVEYSDGTVATVEQMSRDVTVFLAWASEPELEARRAMGLKVIVFILVMFGFALATKRDVWRNIKH